MKIASAIFIRGACDLLGIMSVSFRDTCVTNGIMYFFYGASITRIGFYQAGTLL